jgi:importin subunit beta-1
MSQLTQLLISSQSTNRDEQKGAEEKLKQAEQTNLPIFIVELVVELANEQKPSQARQMAGILLKNILTSGDEQRKIVLAQQWGGLSSEIRQKVKQQIIYTLSSPAKEVRKISAMALARLAVVELSSGNWEDVVDELCNNVIKPKSESQMEASLTCLGYICEESKSDILSKKSHLVLTAVIAGMKSTKLLEIRQSAMKAFLSSIEFFRKNFEVQKERDYIMSTVCECTQSQDLQTRQVAVESLVRITHMYYPVMTDYMQAIFKITSNCIQNDKNEVVLQAIEIWSSLAELEKDIQDEIVYFTDMKQDPPRKCLNFVAAAVRLKLGDLLTISLTKQDENQTEEDWNISAAASTCLQLVTAIVGPIIAEAIIPFILKNLSNENWHYREAATLAFSAILEIPSENMTKALDSSFNVFLQNINHKVVLVKDTSVFMLGRIARYHLPVVLKNIENYMKAMVYCLGEQPRIASKAAWSLYNFADQYGQEDDTNQINAYYKGILEHLLKASERKDANQVNLRINVYAAIGAFINLASGEMTQPLEQIVALFCQRLDAVVKQGNVSNEEREEQNLVISCICGALQSLVNKLGQNVKKYLDNMMGLLLTLLKKGGFGDEIFLVIASVVSVCGADFDRYMPSFAQFLYAGLTNFKDEQTCLTCISITVDLAVGLEGRIEPYVKDLMQIFASNMNNSSLGKNIKPPTLSVFGDLALAIGPKFEGYLQYSTQILKQYSELQVDRNIEEMVNYLFLVHENVLSAYVGILGGFKSNPQPFIPYVDSLLIFLRRIGQEEDIDVEIFTHSVSIIGDLASMYGGKIKQYLADSVIQGMVKRAKESNEKKLKDVGSYAKRQLDRIL